MRAPEEGQALPVLFVGDGRVPDLRGAAAVSQDRLARDGPGASGAEEVTLSSTVVKASAPSGRLTKVP